MSLATKHTRENNESYLEHMLFALKAAALFFVSSAVFVVHAVIPWVEIPKRLNLDQMVLLLIRKRND